jgi:hypothetical protein
MSKNKKSQAVESVLANPQGKTVEELKQIVQTLQTQLQEHQKLANHHQTMATKAQGALEVTLQMIPKEEVEEMIQKEAKETENHQMDGQKTS